MAGNPAELFPEDLKAMMDESREGSYVLLDVRQPAEYELSHLPGARLVPLPLLADSLGELDREKRTVVYCAAGGRSLMAARFLARRGFDTVYQLVGGIQAWELPTATGPTGFPLRFVKGDEEPEEVIALAFRMEDGLKRFHEKMKEGVTDPGLSTLLDHLIRADEGHKRNLLALLPDGATKETLERWDEASPGADDLMEGGVDVEAYLEENRAFIGTVPGYMDLAMMIETQALDLYLGMADVSRNESSRLVLLRIAEEEKTHLNMLGDYLEAHARGPAGSPDAA